MGQSVSSNGSIRSRSKSLSAKLSSSTEVSRERSQSKETLADSRRDYTSDLPDECLEYIFQSLGSGDRNRCALVCRRWLQVEGQSRHRLSLDARADLLNAIPMLFSRFTAITKLALKCDRRCISIGDEALILLSFKCPNLTRFKLRACRELTDTGMAAFARNSPHLKKLSCGSCMFGSEGMNAVLEYCRELEELSIKRLHGITNEAAVPITPGAAASSLRSICLKEIYNAQCFGPLIAGSKNLRTLRLFRCSGEWDNVLVSASDRAARLVEIHLERIQVGDRALTAISTFPNLEILHLVKTPECTDAGLISIAERCKLLRKLHIDGWRMNRIGDEGLTAVAKRCSNLQELVLMGVNPSTSCLGFIASNCQNLERLALCGSETVGDAALSCIASKCVALKKLCIKGCPVSDHGMEALASGCPNLVKVKVKKCRMVTSEGAEWLRQSRGSLAVNLDTGFAEQHDASASDSGLQETITDQRPLADQARSNLPSSSAGRTTMFRSRIGFSSGRGVMNCPFGRWSHSNSNGYSS